LDFAIALEALLLPGDRDAGQGNLSYRFRVSEGFPRAQDFNEMLLHSDAPLTGVPASEQSSAG
jgi:hypothetical protein